MGQVQVKLFSNGDDLLYVFKSLLKVQYKKLKKRSHFMLRIGNIMIRVENKRIKTRLFLNKMIR